MKICGEREWGNDYVAGGHRREILLLYGRTFDLCRNDVIYAMLSEGNNSDHSRYVGEGEM